MADGPQKELLDAARNKDSDVLRSLLQSGSVDVNRTTGWQGETALMKAAWWGRETNVQMLLSLPGDTRVDVNLQDFQGKTALMMAAELGYEKCVQVLLEYQVNGRPVVDVNLQDECGKTALMMAAEMGNVECVQMLLAHQVHGRHEVDVNLQDKDGKTALMLTAAGHYVSAKCLRTLLGYQVDGRHVVDVNVEDRDGKTALTLALFGYVEEMLLSRPDTHIDVKWMRKHWYFSPPRASASQLLSLMIGVEPALLNSLPPKQKRPNQPEQPPSTLSVLPYYLVRDEVLPKCRFDPVPMLSYSAELEEARAGLEQAKRDVDIYGGRARDSEAEESDEDSEDSGERRAQELEDAQVYYDQTHELAEEEVAKDNYNYDGHDATMAAISYHMRMAPRLWSAWHGQA